MPLRLYNTLSRRLEAFAPADPSRVTFYSCGPTVYDDAHIGNFRSFLAADVLRRWLESPLCRVTGPGGVEHSGPRRVVHVMNITDVGHMTDDAAGGESGEDRMAVAGRRLAEAKKAGKLPAGVSVDERDPYAIARFYEDRFKEDARRLGLKVAIEAKADATLMPRATEHVAGMIAVIRRLLAGGFAYTAGSPGSRAVYFRVRRFEGYGRLSGNTLDQLREGEGGRVRAGHQSEKEHPADFLLWKEDAGHLMSWEADFSGFGGGPAWGKGYPGWHIECTAMSVSRLLSREGGVLGPEALAGLTRPDAEALIDLHSGGEDNIFPHHECEMAQSCCAFNASPGGGGFARHWMHARFLLVNGEKMSKSKGNFYTPRELFERGVEPAAVRLALISSHYRSNADFTDELLKASERRIRRWRRAAAAAQAARKREDTPLDNEGRVALGRDVGVREPRFSNGRLFEALQQFERCLNDDLNVPGALAAVEDLCGWSSDNDAPLAPEPDPGFEPRPWDRMVPTDPEQIQAVLYERTYDYEYNAWHHVDRVLGVIFNAPRPEVAHGIGVYAPGVAQDTALEKLLVERRDARASKDYAASDKIRTQIATMGYAIKDLPDGRVEIRRA